MSGMNNNRRPGVGGRKGIDRTGTMTKARSSVRHGALSSMGIALIAALFGLIIAAMCIPNAAEAAESTPRISYDGASQTLTLENAGSDASETDLFTAFKDLVPGDTRTQQIDIAATHLNGTTKVYVQAETDDATARALAPLRLKVTGSETAASESAPHKVFEKAVRVATLTEDGSQTLNVCLIVPTSVGNELADSQHLIRWTVTVEDDAGVHQAKPASDANPLAGMLSPKTGDIGTWIVVLIAVVAIAAGIVAWWSRKRRSAVSDE